MMTDNELFAVYHQDVKPVLVHSFYFVAAFWTAWLTENWTLPFMVAIVSSGHIAWRHDLRMCSFHTGIATADDIDDSNSREVSLYAREIQMLVMEVMLIAGHLSIEIANLVGYLKLHDPVLFQEQINALSSNEGLWFLEAPSPVFRISFEVYVYAYVYFVQLHTISNLFRMARTPTVRTIWRYETKELVQSAGTIVLGYELIKYLESNMAKVPLVQWFLIVTLVSMWIYCLLKASLWSRPIPLTRSNDRAGHLIILEATRVQQMFGHVLRNAMHSGFLSYEHLVLGCLNQKLLLVTSWSSKSSGKLVSSTDTMDLIFLAPRIDLIYFAFTTVQIARFLKLEHDSVQLMRALNDRNDDLLF